MSIFIFGNVGTGADETLNWTGNWYFAKNKVNNTTFSYTKCASDVVDRDLVDYVSFANEPQLEKPPGVRKSRKGKWQRGRPRSNSSALDVEIGGSARVVNSEGSAGDVPIETETPSTLSATGTHGQDKDNNVQLDGMVRDSSAELVAEGNDDGEADDGDDDDDDSEDHEGEEEEEEEEEEDVTYGDKHIGMDTLEAKVLTAPSSSNNVGTKSGDEAAALIRIPPLHPLFGVWEGSFSLPVKTNHYGTRGERRDDELVQETFFFYALEGDQQGGGGETVPGLEALPHPPRWTAGFIRELHSADRHDHLHREEGGGGDPSSASSTPSPLPAAPPPRASSSGGGQHDQKQEQEQEQEQDRISALVQSSGGDSPTLLKQSTSICSAPRAMKKEVSFDTDLVSQNVPPAGSAKQNQPKEEQQGGSRGREDDAESSSLDSVSAIDTASGAAAAAAAAAAAVSASLRPTRASASAGPEPSSPEAAPLNVKTDSGEEKHGSTTCAVTPATPRYSQQQITPNSALLVPPAEEVMLVGFGRNLYGRFSLAGAYNPRTGSLRCERKYMLTKSAPPAKPGRRPGSSTTSSGPSTKDSGFGKRPVRAKRAHSVDTGAAFLDPGDASATLLSTTASGKRKRSTSQWLLQEGGGELDELEDAAHSSATPSGKRGRKKGGYAAALATVPHVMTSSQFMSTQEAVAESDGYRRAFLDPTTGEVYEGEWRYGHRNGFGVCLFPDGTMYEGWWLNNKEHGAAGLWMTGAREVLYSGEWAEGRLHGTGTYYFPSGDVYAGEFKEGARHGKGRYVRADGSSYEGDWKDNVRHGRGVFVWPDGSEYEGDWEGGQRSGRGELLLANKLRYSGTWACNFMEGRGELIFPDGQVYKGIFKNGLREGRGSLAFPEGATYEGRFREDALDGQGTLKITQAVPGGADDEVFIPLDNLADIRRIHLKSGFGGDAHH